MAVQKKLTKSGKTRWIGRYRDAAGKERSKSFDTQREAKAWVSEMERALRRNEWIDPVDAATTLRQVAQKWADEATNPETITTRRSLLISLGPLGDMPVAKIKTSDILAWRKKLLEGRDWLTDNSRLSEGTTANTVGQLMSVLKRAQEDRMILVVPTVKVAKSAPLRALSRQDLLTQKDVQQVASASITKKGRYIAKWWLRTMLLVAAGSGMRVAELCGLRVSDIDFLRHTITVSRQIGRGDEARPPKSAAGFRKIPVAKWVTEELSDWLRENPAGPDDYVWRRDDGRPHDRNSATHALASTVKTHELRRITFHDFRHFYASALIAGGAAVNSVQSALGHASAAVTMEVYSHLWPGQEDLARGALAGLSGVRDFCGIGDEKTPDSQTG